MSELFVFTGRDILSTVHTFGTFDSKADAREWNFKRAFPLSEISICNLHDPSGPENVVDPE